MTIKSLLDESTTIYDYIKLKESACTYMTVSPKQTLVERQVQGLGFKVTSKGKSTAEVLLNPKEDDLRVKLGLAHYSLQLSSIFILEGIVAQIVKNHFWDQASKEPLHV